MAGKGGGAWKVAYADFVTAMMAFFMVMWIVAQGKEVKEAVAGYFNDPGKSIGFHGSASPTPMGLPGQSRPSPPAKKGSSEGDRKKAAGVGQGGESKHKRGFFAVHSGERTQIGTAVVFAETSAELDAAAKGQLDHILSEIAGKPNKLEIRAHASRRPLPPESEFKDGWQLTFARCINTMDYLEKKGISPERIRLCQAGPYEPYTIQVVPEMQKYNSRVEVYVLNEFAQDLVGSSQERDALFNAPAGH